MSYVFAPPAQPALPIAGRDELFPVRRVFCIGRNYAEHAREMGADERDPPFYFMKPADAVFAGDGAVPRSLASCCKSRRVRSMPTA